MSAYPYHSSFLIAKSTMTFILKILMSTKLLLASMETMQVWVWDSHPIRASIKALFDIFDDSWNASCCNEGKENWSIEVLKPSTFNSGWEEKL